MAILDRGVGTVAESSAEADFPRGDNRLTGHLGNAVADTERGEVAIDALHFDARSVGHGESIQI